VLPSLSLIGTATLQDEGIAVVGHPETHGHAFAIDMHAWTGAMAAAWDADALQRGSSGESPA